MAKDTIFLGDHFERFVDGEVASGRYSSSSEVVRDALRLLEEKRRAERALSRTWVEGKESGLAEDFDVDGLVAEIDSPAKS